MQMIDILLKYRYILFNELLNDLDAQRDFDKKKISQKSWSNSTILILSML